MQVFVPFKNPFECAKVLDDRRLNKQIIECRQILKAIRGESSAWANHPCTKMYRDHEQWLTHYMHCLELYKSHKDMCDEDFDEATLDLFLAMEIDEMANAMTPPFLTEEFCIQHRRRLYTKNFRYYLQFEEYGTSNENWYFVNGETVKYINGRRIN